MEIITEKADYKDFHLTGYFRDGLRRIDIVIVSRDNNDEEIESLKINFLLNAMGAGFQLEIEAGVKERHKHLLFIKVHAPNNILRHFGIVFNIRKYFKTSHAQFVQSAVKGEKDLINLVRQSYPGPVNYSTMERSMIVYKTLLLVTFGAPRNYIGIQRAVDCGIFLDVYPLHDGPHFFVRGQLVSQVNGRQALFYTWIGYSNLLSCQPVNLIREYLGDRFGFLFAFSQYVIYYLFFCGLPGVGMFYLNYYNVTDRHFNLKPEENNIVAAKCKDFVGCPFRTLQNYTREMEIKAWLDNPYAIVYILFVTVSGIVLQLLWKRREYYLNWLWEVEEEETKSAVRTRYTPWSTFKLEKGDVTNRDQSKKKIKQSFRRIVKPALRFSQTKEERSALLWKCAEFSLTMTLLCFFFLLYLPGILSLQYKLGNRMRYVEEICKRTEWFKNEYNMVQMFQNFNLEITSTMNGMCILLLEMVWVNIATWFTYMTNSRTERIYDRSHVIKLFGFTFIINFGFIFLITFLKGTLYTFPTDMERWNLPHHLGVMNCGIMTCIDEVFIVIIATYKTKTIFREILDIVENIQLRRDVPGEAADDDEDVPCWEREYELMPLTEDFVMNKFNQIFIQIAFAMFFVWVFPLAPLCIFLVMLWEIRYWARMILLYSRRPLITQTWGLGTWRKILWILPYAAVLCNVLGYARNTMSLDRNFEARYFTHSKEGKFFQKYFMGYFNSETWDEEPPSELDVSDPRAMFITVRHSFNDTPFTGSFLFPAQYHKYRWGSQSYPHDYIPQTGKWYINWHQALVVLLVESIVVLSGLLLHYLIDTSTEELREITKVEKSIKNYEMRYDIVREDSNP